MECALDFASFTAASFADRACLLQRLQGAPSELCCLLSSLGLWNGVSLVAGFCQWPFSPLALGSGTDYPSPELVSAPPPKKTQLILSPTPTLHMYTRSLILVCSVASHPGCCSWRVHDLFFSFRISAAGGCFTLYVSAACVIVFLFCHFQLKRSSLWVVLPLSPLLALGTLAILCLKTQGVGHTHKGLRASCRLSLGLHAFLHTAPATIASNALLVCGIG